MNNFNFGGRFGRLASSAIFGMAVLAGCGGGKDAASTGPVAASATVNHAPVAAMTLAGIMQAGGAAADITVSAGTSLAISAAATTDADHDAISYQWSITTRPAGSTLALASDSALSQALVPDLPGTYVLNLKASDSKGAFSEKSVTVVVTNNVAPVLNVVVAADYAGTSTTKATRLLNVGSAVVFDPAGATDADGDAVTTTWTLDQKPAASGAALQAAGGASHLMLDVPGLYKVRARGTDARGAWSETLYVYEASNNAPRTVVLTSVLPGEPGNVWSSMFPNVGDLVALDAGTSTDDDGDALTYAWTITQQPAGSSAALTSTSGASSQLTPDMLGDYVVKVTGTDPSGAASSHIINISVNNYRPVAAIIASGVAGSTLNGVTAHAALGVALTLKGGTSVDGDGDSMTYGWTLRSQPAASGAALSAASGATVQLTPDVAGAYDVVLRATDSKGAYSERSMVIAAGTYLPVAVVDRAVMSVVAGSAAKASAARSFDPDGEALTYSWEIDARPSASTAAIANPGAAALSFTPDVAGLYVASVTVSDGKASSIAYVVIKALAAAPTAIPLPFIPLQSRYSRGLDKLVAVSANPNSLKIVDPFSGVIKTVLLPAAVTSLNLSADGKLAAVLHQGTLSLVQLETATLLRTTPAGGAYTEAFINNAGVSYLLGQVADAAGVPLMTILDARTGVNLTASLVQSTVPMTGKQAGVFSARKNRAFYLGMYPSPLRYFDVQASSGAVTGWGESAYTSLQYDMQAPLFLDETEDRVITAYGNVFRADNLQFISRLPNIYGPVRSLSHSGATDETILTFSQPVLTANGSLTAGYSTYYQAYSGAAYATVQVAVLPKINGQQGYAVQVYHSANSNHVVLVATGTPAEDGVGASYHLLVR